MAIEGDKTIFRVWKHGYGKGDVVALFPRIAACYNGAACESYEHIGQHGAASPWLVVKRTRPAKPREYQELKEELEQIGYNVCVMKRCTYADYLVRKAQAKNWW